MPVSFLEDSGFNAGMVRDQPSWQLPNGAVYDQLNMLNDQPGIARQRMGTSFLSALGAQTAFASSLGFVYSTDSTTIEELYGCTSSGLGINLVNKSTGAVTSLGTTTGSFTVGRPARHFGFLGFTGPDTTQFYRAMWVAGQTTVSNFVTTVAVVITAGSPQLTLGGADVTTNIKVGAVVQCFNGTTNAYLGRVVSVDSSTKFTVWPTPSLTFTTSAAGVLTSAEAIGVGADTNAFGGRCITSFQNRLLFGGVNDPSNSANPTRYDRRIAYSVLPTENVTSSSGAITTNGATFLAMNKWPALNYLDVPGADPIVAMEPISDGELLILTTRDLVIFNGNLVTQLATTSPTVTYDVYPLGTTNGCLSDLSVHRTPVGIMWAGNEGVFAYWPPLRRNPAKTGIRNLMDNKILTYWQSLVNPSSGSFVIHGAAYVRNHYIVSGTSNGVTFSLACNLQNDQWTRLSGAGTDIFTSAARPSAPQQVFGLRWWDTSGGAPSMTNGQVVRLETMMNKYAPATSNQDADNNTIPISITTRTITGDAETQKLFQRGTIRYAAAQSAGAGSLPVTAQSVIDAADVTAASVRSLGSLSNTEVRTLNNATNANPIQCTTTTNHGLQTDDFVDINGVLGNLNANGRWRINRVDQTNFTLVGSSGSAAYTSGGSVKKLTEQDYLLSSLDAGQGASVTITGTPNNFELHGVRLAVLQKPPVESA